MNSLNTSYFKSKSKPDKPRPISSAILDLLLMPKSKEKKKSDHVTQPNSSLRLIETEYSCSELNNSLSHVKKVDLDVGVPSKWSTRSNSTLKEVYCSIKSTGSSRSGSSSSSDVQSLISSHNKETESSLNSSDSSIVFNTPNSSLTTITGTPELKQTSFSTPNASASRAFKRSFSDRLAEEKGTSPSASSSNSSLYLTPDQSPDGYGSASKRFKSRWNHSRSSYGSDSSEYLNGSLSSIGSPEHDSGVVQPVLIGYQLVGDSQFCRFGQQLLGLKRVFMPNSSGRIGICVSGQTITDLHRRVKEKFYPITDKIILMIGTNDFLKNTDISTMCKELSALVQTLQETVTKIILLTLPPIPKLEKKMRSHHFMMLEKYNTFIRSLNNGDRLKIADVSPNYMTPLPFRTCRMDLFEKFFNGPNPRLDMIHLNKEGLEVIRKYILEKFLLV